MRVGLVLAGIEHCAREDFSWIGTRHFGGGHSGRAGAGNRCRSCNSSRRKDILIACIDGLKGFPEAIEAVFPKTQVQLCIVHMIRNSLRFVSWKERRAVVADLRAVYTAPTEEAGRAALNAFRAKWDVKFPSIGRGWEQNWVHLSPFFAYPEAIRKVIYTTNAIESINSSIRKVTKKRGAFPNPESVRKVIYLAIQKASANWRNSIYAWPAAINHFSIAFEGGI